MLSPIKAIIAGVLVAVGGLFLVAQPFELREATVPGAHTVVPSGVSVTVSQDCDQVPAPPKVCDWSGHLYSVWTGPAQLFVFLSGDGEYQGWHYVGMTIDSGVEPGDTGWTGVVYEGDPPPFGPPSSTSG